MISRRNYFTITVIMFIVLFLFQFSNVALESWNNYEVNDYIVDTSEISNRNDAFSADVNERQSEFAHDLREMVIFIGDQEAVVGETASLWTSYTKRNWAAYPTLEAYEKAKTVQRDVAPAMILIEAAELDWKKEGNCDLLEAYVEAGIPLIFCNLPKVSVLKENKQLQELLGIETIRAEEMAVAELHLHQDFLLGGEAVYSEEGLEEGLEFTFPWYEVTSESKIYMNGMPKKRTAGLDALTDAELPAVLWRRDTETAPVFVVNGSYLEDIAGLGILSAMSAEMGSYEIYPVVNAQNLIYANYPGLAEENDDVLMEQYSQSLEGLYQNVVWPDVVAVRREHSLALSCMLSPQLDYEDDSYPDVSQFQRYMKLLNEQRAETGLSGTCHSDTSIEKKVAKDEEFMQEALPTYQFTSFYPGGLTEKEVWAVLQEDLFASVRTVVEKYEEENGDKEVIGYLSEYITRQCAVIDGLEDTVRYDFRSRCLETALGYVSVLVDMEDIVYPKEEKDEWALASNILRKNLQDYRFGEQGFDCTTVSECDERIRSFLALDYKAYREFNTISLERNSAKGVVWFVLRTNREKIESVEGGSWKQLEEDAYLVRVEQEKAKITLKAAY